MALTISDEGLENIQLSSEVKKKALQKAREGYVIALLEVGEISSGRAAKILGVSRIKMIEMMNKWGISIFDEEQDLDELGQLVRASCSRHQLSSRHKSS